MINCIFWSDADGEIVDNGGTPTVERCVVQGGYSGPNATNIIVADPLLAPLSRNVGPMETFQLLPGSSAIDAGTGAGTSATDQRGVARPQGSGFDIGAYESWSKKILTVDVSGAGTVNRTPAGDVFGTTGDCCQYDEGTSVVLTASSDAGNMFVEWSGALTGSADSGTTTMSMDHAVSALFDIAWIITASAEPHGSIDPSGDVTLTLTLVSGGGIIVGPWDIFDTKARLELLESPSLWAQLLATDPDALAAGDFNIGLVRFLSFVAELDQDELEITVLFTVIVGDAPTGYRAVVFLLMRTFDASGKPTGYIVVPRSEGKNVFRKKVGTEIWKVTIRDGGATDADGKRNGLVMPQIAAVVAVFPKATPTNTVTPTAGSTGSGGGCSLSANGSAVLAALLLLAPVVLLRR